MMKRFAFVLALALLPSAAMAQQHEHAKKEMAQPAAAHMNFAQELIAAKADLNLTAEQITKLEALSAKMDEMHKMMAMHGDKMQAKTEQKADAKAEPKMDGKHDMSQMEGKMHVELLSIFTEEQLTKVRPMMKAHMDKMMGGAAKTEHKH